MALRWLAFSVCDIVAEYKFDRAIENKLVMMSDDG